MKPISLHRAAWFATLCAGLCIAAAARAGLPASSIPAADLLEPAQLAAALQDAHAARPLVLQVGFKKLFDQAHIVGAEYAGAAGSEEGVQQLRTRVQTLDRGAPIVIYCGCCPWSRCPNMAAAYTLLKELGFRQVRALHIATDFGTDWVDKGYAVTRGP